MFSRCQPWLGTLVQIDCTDDATHDAALCIQATQAAFTAVRHVHERMSYQEPTSDLGRFNASAPGHWVALGPATAEVLGFALLLSAQSEGIFDVTAGPRAAQTTTGNWQDIELDAANLRLRKHAHLHIDLSGLAKGYAVDLAVRALQRAGVARGAVNAGGDCRVFGDARRALHVRAPWALGQTLALPELYQRSAATSASYLLDTPVLRDGRSGVAVDASLSATVTAPTCMAADALTKIVAITNDNQHHLLLTYDATAWIFRAKP